MTGKGTQSAGWQGAALDAQGASHLNVLLPEPLPESGFPIFKMWLDEAIEKRITPNPNAFALATIDPDGMLGNRIVLCKELDVAQGSLVFHTNYRGRKGRALDANHKAAGVFHWDAFERQVRVEGLAQRVSEAESEAYFQTRPWVRKVGAWVSDQSEPIGSREELDAKLQATLRRFGIDPANLPKDDAWVDVPRPPHWGGYRLTAASLELWVGAPGRLHDRAVWKREVRRGSAAGPPEAGAWRSTRLQP